MLRASILLCCVSTLILITDARDCQARRELQRRAGNVDMPGFYEVECEEDAPEEYKPKQCWPSTGRCWCVDQYGVTIPNSHVNPGQDIDCSTFGWCKSFEASLLDEMSDTRPPNDEDEETEKILPPGSPTPNCDDNGHFARSQTWGSTGQSWCAVENGNKIPGTLTGPGAPPFDCDNLPPCLAKEGDLAHLAVDDIYPFGLDRPQCDEHGKFRRTQCSASNGYCWCVDPETGEEIEGSAVGPGSSEVLDCDNLTSKVEEEANTPCRMLEQKQIKHLLAQERPLLGFWRVKCEDDGKFSPSQCHPSTGQCWCVDENGKEQPGTRSAPGSPPFPCKMLTVANCEAEKNTVESRYEDLMMIGMFSPQCEEDGKYKAKQCWASTGQCWCVTPTGQEITYTRRGPGQSPGDLDCSKLNAASTSRVLLRDDVGGEGDEAAAASKLGMSTTLIAIIVVLSCLLLVAVIAGVILYKKNNAAPSGMRYTEVNPDL